MRTLAGIVVVCSLFVARSGAAQSNTESPEPGAPQSAAAPAPPPPAPSTSVGGAASSGDWKFDYHGYFRAPLRLGFGHQDNPPMGQSSRTVHNVIVPDDQYLGWQYTPNQSKDWSELFFSYGNNWVKGTVGLQGYNFTDAAWEQASAQFGIAQAWLTVTPKLGFLNVRLDGKIGAFWDKYGMAGKYDAGKYDTYLFGRTHQMGETVRLSIDVGKFNLWAEEGFGVKQPDPNVYNPSKFSLLAHGHGGINWNKMVSLNLHFLYAWSQEEDREANGTQPFTGLPDGHLFIVGPELAIRNTLVGELYLGYSHIGLTTATTVTDVVEVIHSGGGQAFSQGLQGNYLDSTHPTSSNGPSGGTGAIDTLLLQYDFSLQGLLNGIRKQGFWGDGPDLTASFFMMYNKIASNDPKMDGVHKLKYGVDALGTPLKWLGVGLRFDRVQPNSDIPEQSFAIVTPRLMFRTAFLTHEEINFSYSRYLYNARTCPKTGDPSLCVQPPPAAVLPSGFGAPQASLDNNQRGTPITDPTSAFGRPDENVVKLSASMWW
jgi:hypothetical protein